MLDVVLFSEDQLGVYLAAGLEQEVGIVPARMLEAKAARLSEKWLSGMQAQALVLEAHHTTHIEGTHLTLDQSKRLLAGEQLAGVDPEDERELLNYRNAFELVSDYLGSGEPIIEVSSAKFINAWCGVSGARRPPRANTGRCRTIS